MALVGKERKCQTVGDFIARDQARHDLRPGGLLTIGDGECRRHHGRARVATAHLVGVLEIEQVREPRIGKGSRTRGHARRHAESHRLRLAPGLLDVDAHRTCLVEISSAYHHADRVEQSEGHALADRSRQLVRLHRCSKHS